MNKKEKIYLDTSVINFLYYDQAPDYKDATIELFENFISKEIYEACFSAYVIDEINATKDQEKKNQLLNTFVDYPLKAIEVIDFKELQNLADFYVQRKIIPEKKYLDALHIAVSVINDIDYLISWNFRHLANINKERLVHAANLELGYTKIMRIITPLELINYDTENS